MAATSAPSAAPPPAATLRAGTIANAAYTFYVAAERGYFQEQGIDLQQEVFSGGNDMTASLATGQLDVGQTAVQVSLLNALLREVPVRAIFDTNHFGVGQPGYGVVARKELWDSGAVRQLTDLVGRKVAIGGAAGGPGIDVERGLQAHGYSLADLDLQIIRQPDIPVALANGAVDGGIINEPGLSATVNREVAVVLNYLSEFYPNHQLAVLASGPSFAARPEVARRFAVGFLRAVRDWADASQHGVGVEAMARLLAANNGLSVELNTDLLQRRALALMDPDGRVNKASIQYDAEWYVRNGLLERVPDVDRFVDPQYADYAVSQLGPYAPRRP